jgi:hypothetical protein
MCFGCAYWPNLRPYNTRKLHFHSKQCAFFGYSVSCIKVLSVLMWPLVVYIFLMTSFFMKRRSLSPLFILTPVLIFVLKLFSFRRLKNPSSTSGVNNVTDHSVIFPNLPASEPIYADTGADSVVISPGNNLDETSHGTPGETFQAQDSKVPSVQHMVHAAPASEDMVPAMPAHGACGTSTSLHEH